MQTIELTQSGDGGPVTVMVSAIRAFHPRRYERPGTRIVFLDGRGMPVEEDYQEVRNRLTAANGQS